MLNFVKSLLKFNNFNIFVLPVKEIILQNLTPAFVILSLNDNAKVVIFCELRKYFQLMYVKEIIFFSI